MTARLRLAVMGAGLIGRQHARRILAREDAVLSAIIDPAPAAHGFAAEIGVPAYASLAALLDAHRPDGVILATPNQLHLAHALACIAERLPILVEKPLADTVANGRALADAARLAGVPVLVGHHRRYSASLRRARQLLEAEALGTIVSVSALFWVYKPDGYFAEAWRTRRGAGPVFLNLIHDIDSLRFLLGDIVRVQAQLSARQRGHDVEDSAAILAEFRSGVLATFSVSDTIVAPWSWEMTSGENPAYPRTSEACYFLGGTHGSLAMPNLVHWRNGAARGWWEPFEREGIAVPDEDPLIGQLDHWCAVLRGEAAPLVTAEDGLANIAVVDAIERAALSGKPAVPFG
jgi:predicted dehydrogenase